MRHDPSAVRYPFAALPRLRAHFGQKADAGLDPLVEIGEMKTLVRSMDSVAGEPEAHQRDGNPQHILNERNDRNRSAVAKKDRRRVESLAIGPRGCDDRRVGAVDQRGSRAHQCPNASLHGGGEDPRDMLAKEPVDFARVLVGSETKVNLRHGASWNRCFDAGPLIASDY